MLLFLTPHIVQKVIFIEFHLWHLCPEICLMQSQSSPVWHSPSPLCAVLICLFLIKSSSASHSSLKFTSSGGVEKEWSRRVTNSCWQIKQTAFHMLTLAHEESLWKSLNNKDKICNMDSSPPCPFAHNNFAAKSVPQSCFFHVFQYLASLLKGALWSSGRRNQYQPFSKA